MSSICLFWIFQMVLLGIAVMGATYSRTIILPLQEAIRHAYALSDNAIGVLQGPALAIPVVLMAIPIGFLIDRYSRVRLLVLFAAVIVSASFVTVVATNFAMLIAARCFIGLAA